MKQEQHQLSYYVIKGITLYRVIAAPFLIVLILTGRYDIFKWLLAVSFFTDLIDGYLARKFKVTSILGAKLDSVGDDLTILVGLTGLIVIHPYFIQQYKILLLIPLLLLVLQMIYAFIRYRKMTSFHTYLAKTAAILQGVFLILFFLMNKPQLILFYAAVLVTTLELIEEMMIVYLLPSWQANVKGLYWIIKKKKKAA